MIKKINAILALLTGFLAIAHIFLRGGLLVGVFPFMMIMKAIDHSILLVFILHVCLSICILFFSGNPNFKYIQYNHSTFAQRAFGILLMIMIHCHSQNYFANGQLVQPSVIGMISEILFTFLFVAHFNISIDKGLTTLGLYNKKVEIIVKVLTIIYGLLAIYAIITYFVGGMR